MANKPRTGGYPGLDIVNWRTVSTNLLFGTGRTFTLEEYQAAEGVARWLLNQIHARAESLGPDYAFVSMNRPQRRVFDLVILGYDRHEIAEILECKARSVSNRVTEIVKILRCQRGMEGISLWAEENSHIIAAHPTEDLNTDEEDDEV